MEMFHKIRGTVIFEDDDIQSFEYLKSHYVCCVDL